MIESLEVENFRCFKRLSLDDLGLINVVVGDNGSGKTSLLEAISFGTGGSPFQAMKYRAWRGLGNIGAVSLLRSAYEAFWKDLFYKQDLTREIKVLLRGDAETRRSLRVFFQRQTVTPISASDAGSEAASSPQDTTAIIPIVFEWTDAEDNPHPMMAQFIGTELVTEGTPLPALSAFFSSSFAAVIGPQEPASQFSSLSTAMKSEHFDDVFTTVYPHVSRLSVETVMGPPMIFCKVPWLPEKIPVGMVSSGAHKLMSLLLGMAHHARGAVFVDELENGFYYKALPDVWKALLRFAEEYRVQLFVTTHSRECLQAAAKIIRRKESKFRLIRVENVKGKRTVRKFAGDEFEAAVERNFELR